MTDRPTLPPALLRRIGAALYGEPFQTRLADELACIRQEETMKISLRRSRARYMPAWEISLRGFTIIRPSFVLRVSWL